MNKFYSYEIQIFTGLSAHDLSVIVRRTQTVKRFEFASIWWTTLALAGGFGVSDRSRQGNRKRNFVH